MQFSPSWVFSVRLFVEINGNIDSSSLWPLIKPYKVNLTDLIDKSLVYGEVDIVTALEVITCCSLYGNLKIELSKEEGQQ